MKKALLTGITGQDRSYLAELLLSKGYRVMKCTALSSGREHLIPNALTIYTKIPHSAQSWPSEF